jgi:CheY-like chemotaxis protein
MTHVVLADDSQTTRKVVELSLAGEDIELRTFTDGVVAREYLRTHSVDAVLVDASLPSVDGYEICRELKQDPTRSHVPVVLLTRTFEPLDAERARLAGCDGCLTKPFETSSLADLVRSMLVRRSGALSAVPASSGSEAGGAVADAGTMPSFSAAPEAEKPAASLELRPQRRQAVPPWSASGFRSITPAKGETTTVSKKVLFTLSRAQCRPNPSFLPREEPSVAVAEPLLETPAVQAVEVVGAVCASSAGPGLSLGPEEIELLVSRVSERLAAEVPRILAEVFQGLSSPR